MATPEPASLAAIVAVTDAVLNQRPASAQLACGAVPSMRTVAVRTASALPALSVEE